MMIGQYEAKVAAKFQVSLPRKFREVLGEKVILTKGLGQCIMIVSAASWQVLTEGTADKAFIDKNSHEVQRFLLGNATEVDLDRKGRCVLPEFLREFAGISTDVVFVGMQRYVEIWEKKAWDRYQAELAGRVESVADTLSRMPKEGTAL